MIAYRNKLVRDVWMRRARRKAVSYDQERKTSEGDSRASTQNSDAQGRDGDAAAPEADQPSA